MRERDMKTAKIFGVLERIQEFEKKILEVNHVVDVEFDLDGFWSDIRQVIFLPKYDIPVDLPDYYAVRRAMLEEVLGVAKEFGLNPSGDRIEDYGEHFYIVRDCDNSWVLQKDETYAEPEIVEAIEEAARDVVGKYDWTMPEYSSDKYDDYNHYDSVCHDIGHERRGEICGFVKQRLIVAGKIAAEDESYDEIIDETAWDEITNYICKNMDDDPKIEYVEYIGNVYEVYEVGDEWVTLLDTLDGLPLKLSKAEFDGLRKLEESDFSCSIDNIVAAAAERSQATDNNESKVVEFEKE